MTIHISNSSASVTVRSYAHTEDGLVVWLELAPQHPKLMGAIWADLVTGTRRYLQLKDEDKGLGKVVYGLGRAYLRLEQDAPHLAVGQNARARLMRLIAPEAVRPVSLDQPFYVFGWPGIPPETVLAAALEKTAPSPVQDGWGVYLLKVALESEYVTPLVTGGPAMQGYEVSASVNWPDFISQGLQKGHILSNLAPAASHRSYSARLLQREFRHCRGSGNPGASSNPAHTPCGVSPRGNMVLFSSFPPTFFIREDIIIRKHSNRFAGDCMEDTEAIAKLKAGDIAGLRSLVEMYQVEAVKAACLIIGDWAAAEDIVQSAFLQAYEKIAGFNEGRPFRPWFLRMVVNEARKAADRQRRLISLEDDKEAGYHALLQRLDTTVREPEDVVQRKELADEMQRALDRISPSQRAAVVLHYFLDLSTVEAADRLNCAPGTLRWHLSMAREKLRALLTEFK